MAHESDETTAERGRASRDTKRLYGRERLVHEDETPRGLLSVQELRHVRHAHRLNRPDRNALYERLDGRIDHFLETEWPILADAYPEYATRIREIVCENGESDD
jgi:hypothetical protein